MRFPAVSVKVKGIKIIGDGKFQDNLCQEKVEAVLTFILNRNADHSTLTLNIDDKVAYRIDAEIAGKILELIRKATD